MNELYSHKTTCHSGDIPLVRQPLFRHPITPTAHYSDSPILRQPITPTSQYSDSSLLRQPIIPTPYYSDNTSVIVVAVKETEKAVNSLKKEDPKIWQHLNQHDMFSILPLRAWFLSGFADILPNTSMERIWDKVVGGSFAVLVHVAVAIFLTFKRPLLSMNNRESMLKYLSKVRNCFVFKITQC
ncbi:TBC1D7 [Mytilus edulis]|uniref:TBC1 domain family member 7 n=1 Tax=Mytilus edulis TaxID=6550 RepID=A0A8S3TH22_MYTED|nr:TBC1D7 [Mytilus edulis]